MKNRKNNEENERLEEDVVVKQESQEAKIGEVIDETNTLKSRVINIAKKSKTVILTTIGIVGFIGLGVLIGKHMSDSDDDMDDLDVSDEVNETVNEIDEVVAE